MREFWITECYLHIDRDGDGIAELLKVTLAVGAGEVSSGARNIDNIVNGTLLPELSGEFLSRMAEGVAVSKASIDIGEDGNFAYTVE